MLFHMHSLSLLMNITYMLKDTSAVYLVLSLHSE